MRREAFDLPSKKVAVFVPPRVGFDLHAQDSKELVYLGKFRVDSNAKGYAVLFASQPSRVRKVLHPLQRQRGCVVTRAGDCICDRDIGKDRNLLNPPPPPPKVEGPKGFTVIVAPMNGANFNINCLPTMTVAGLKDAVAGGNGMPPHYQKLLVSGRDITNYDERLLSEIGLMEGSKVYLLFKMRG
eukprot:TRINITY_DN6446_c0_g1_i1.p1 TRINITY_DN6446_c0_g1~~TRINITY_DN6446_c0_g1_i1.p1  ORF type:complete len:185 (-),score=14.70 TRINITY_DN6446_c0_g1_i1:82-636(-)